MSYRFFCFFMIHLLFLGSCTKNTYQVSQLQKNTSYIQGMEPQKGTIEYRSYIHSQLAAAYYQNEKYGVALEEIQKAIDAKKDYAPAYNVLAIIQWKLEEIEAAQSAFEKALTIAPDNPEILNNYGHFLCHDKDTADQGLYYIQKAMENPLYKTPESAVYNAAICFIRSDQKEKALIYNEEYVAKFPEYKPSHLIAAQIAWELNQKKKAQYHFQFLDKTLVRKITKKKVYTAPTKKQDPCPDEQHSPSEL